MNNLFIDTNLYLAFYEYSSATLEQLNKLSVDIGKKRTRLYVTEQIINEYKRQREETVAKAFDKFRTQTLPNQFPHICKTYDEYNTLRELIRQYQTTKAQLIDKCRSDITARKLVADDTINELFKVAEILLIDEETLTRARNRVTLGNPTGKPNSYGDAVNWELLLRHITGGEDLYLITDDGDFRSSIDPSKLVEFLELEWKDKKKSNIFFYRNLSDFFEEQFPDSEFVAELEKDLAISDLINSRNFAETHEAIKKLSEFKDSTDAEIVELIQASVSNTQIFWISEDPDVRSFFTNIIKGREDIFPPELLKEFNELYGSAEESVEPDDIPL